MPRPASLKNDRIAPTPRTKLRRFHKRGNYEKDTIYPILDEGLICHMGFTDETGQPFVIPTAYARVEDELYIHGSAASRALRTISAGSPLCVTVTLTDGIVLARTAFNHSFNYRSVVVLGHGIAVTDPDEKERALARLTDKLVPGRWDQVRAPTRQELKATTLLTMPIEEASAKLRSGPPGDEGEDLEHDAWAGVIPLETTVLPPVPDPKLPADYRVPDNIAGYTRGNRSNGKAE
jgi:nitroimidazol reductase NimA-like FMN-containing flavoprotein (pyridoxamine 5'-phosphate oxidase superfamily)